MRTLVSTGHVHHRVPFVPVTSGDRVHNFHETPKQFGPRGEESGRGEAVLRGVPNDCFAFRVYFTEMCSGSEAGSYLRLIDFVYHSTLVLIVIQKQEEGASPHPINPGKYGDDYIKALPASHTDSDFSPTVGWCYGRALW